MYGYKSDKGGQSATSFGLNQKARLTKFEYTLNGGTNGAELEALDIAFTVNGKEISYRQFPVKKAFGSKKTGDEGMEYTNPTSSESARAAFERAGAEFSSRITHILKCFVSEDVIKQAFTSNVSSFKEYCDITSALLPAGFEEKPLDLFMHFQWNIKGDNERTFLEIPKSSKYGAFVCPHVEGVFREEKIENPDDSQRGALKYINIESGLEHPFRRNGWYMNSNFANVQKDDNTDAQEAIGGISNAGTESAF